MIYSLLITLSIALPIHSLTNEAEYLLGASRNHVDQIDIQTGATTRLNLTEIKNIKAIQFDQKHNCLYYAQYSHTIGRKCFNGSEPQVITMINRTSPGCMAYDWLSNLLYVIDGQRIDVIQPPYSDAQTPRRQTIVQFSNPQESPIFLVISPTDGYMFYLHKLQEHDGSNTYTIYRTTLDGLRVDLVIELSESQRPKGDRLTIDVAAKRLHWMDVHGIRSCDFSGNSYGVASMTSYSIANQWIMLVIHDGRGFYYNTRDSGVYVANIASMKVRNITRGIVYNSLLVGGNSLQTETNACSDGSHQCDFLCVSAPRASYRCLCADGLVKDGAHGCKCSGTNATPINGMCPLRADGQCHPAMFQCTNNRCLPSARRCDGIYDCSDGLDEIFCAEEGTATVCTTPMRSSRSTAPPTATEQCEPGMFRCSDGQCITEMLRCDFETDCKDGSDELNCANHTCPDGQFRCSENEGRCLPESWVCDSFKDCLNGADEVGCDNQNDNIKALIEATTTSTTPKPDGKLSMTTTTTIDNCEPGMFRCSDGQCITEVLRCDFESDCNDGSDEVNCADHTCRDDQFRCIENEGHCLPRSSICDSTKDCDNGADEVDCDKNESPPLSLPPIEGKLSSITPTSATLSWNHTYLADKNLTYWVYYGPYLTSSMPLDSPPNMVTRDVRVDLDNLSPCTLYYAIVSIADERPFISTMFETEFDVHRQARNVRTEYDSRERAMNITWEHSCSSHKHHPAGYVVTVVNSQTNGISTIQMPSSGHGLQMYQYRNVTKGVVHSFRIAALSVGSESYDGFFRAGSNRANIVTELDDDGETVQMIWPLVDFRDTVVKYEIAIANISESEEAIFHKWIDFVPNVKANTANIVGIRIRTERKKSKQP